MEGRHYGLSSYEDANDYTNRYTHEYAASNKCTYLYAQEDAHRYSREDINAYAYSNAESYSYSNVNAHPDTDSGGA